MEDPNEIMPARACLLVMATSLFLLTLSWIIVALRCFLRYRRRIIGLDDALIAFGLVSSASKSYFMSADHTCSSRSWQLALQRSYRASRVWN
jgi:hypothetical protein